jgi:hypothetical protein
MAVTLVSTGITFPDATTQTTAATASPSTWVYIKTVTASSSATVDIEDAMTDYGVYVITANTVVPSTGGNLFYMRVKSSGSYQTTNYYGTNIYTTNNSTISISNLDSSNELTVINQNQQVAADSALANFSGQFYIYNPSSTKAKLMNSVFIQMNPATNTSKPAYMSAAYSASSTVTGIRFYFSVGTVSVGTFRLYGIRNS